MVIEYRGYGFDKGLVSGFFLREFEIEVFFFYFCFCWKILFCFVLKFLVKEMFFNKNG